VGGYVKPITAAQYLGIPLEEIQAMLESGELPGIKIAGQWRVPLEQLEKWLDEEVSASELKKLATRLKNVQPQTIDQFFQQAASVKPKATPKRSQKPKAKKKSARSKKR
jgi:excisionase family DNA binding protein